MDGINIPLSWSTAGSPLDYGGLSGNYGSYPGGTQHFLSLDGSPTELKICNNSSSSNNAGSSSGASGATSTGAATAATYSGYSYNLPGSSGSPPGGSWYTSSGEGSIHVLHNGDVLRKVEPGHLHIHLHIHLHHIGNVN